MRPMTLADFSCSSPVTARAKSTRIERATDPETLSLVADQYLGDIIEVKEKLDGADEVSGVQVVDDHTIRIDIDAPITTFWPS